MTTTYTPTPSTVPAVPAPTHAIGYRMGRIAWPRDTYVVDGTNVIRGNEAIVSPGLQSLLAVMSALVSDADSLCIFDANTRYVLRDSQGPDAASIYLRLLREYPAFFAECTGGTRADDLILAEADARTATVVSNDRFRDYRMAYSWLTDPTRALRVNRIRDHVHIGGHRIAIPCDWGMAWNNLAIVLDPVTLVSNATMRVNEHACA